MKKETMECFEKAFDTYLEIADIIPENQRTPDTYQRAVDGVLKNSPFDYTLGDANELARTYLAMHPLSEPFIEQVRSMKITEALC